MTPPASAPEEIASRIDGALGRAHPRQPSEDRRLVLVAVRPTFGASVALALDLSAAGVGLLLDRPLDPGAVVAVQLRTTYGEDVVIRAAEVAHVTEHEPVADPPWRKKVSLAARLFGLFRRRGASPPEAARVYFVGCRFRVPLGEDELRSLRQK